MPEPSADVDSIIYDQVFAALAHPTRRKILITLHFEGGAMGAGEIARMFEHAWPMTTRHLRVLEEAGLVRHERQGRARTYHLEPQHIELVRDWIGQLRPAGP